MNSFRSDRRRGWALVLACVAVLLLSTPAAARERGAVMVVVHEGTITLEAVEAAWPDVIRELERRTGMIIHVQWLPEQRITASFTRVDPAQMLHRLFGVSAGFAFVYGSGPVPAEVWVASAAMPSEAMRPSAGPYRPSAMLPSELRVEDPDERVGAALRLASEEGDAAVDTLAHVVATDPDAAVRSAAAKGLIQIGTPRALAAVRHAGIDETRIGLSRN